MLGSAGLLVLAKGKGIIPQFPASSPSPRWGAAMAYDAATGKIVLFGGGTTPQGDTWTWDGSTWTQQHPANSPSPRLGAGMAYDAATQSVVLFGGNGGRRMNDTWIWDGSNWTQRFPPASPPAREDSAMTYDLLAAVVVLFGGTPSDTSAARDTWTWDGNTWTQLAQPASPSLRQGPRMTTDGQTEQVVLFGGFLPGNGYLGDTWVVPLAGPADSPPPPPLQPPAAPSNLGASAVDGADIQLTWTNNADNADSIQIYDGMTDQQIASVSGGTSSYVLSDLTPGSHYCAYVYAYNSAGYSNPSNMACADTPGQ